jgi:chromosomal replication initiator protein
VRTPIDGVRDAVRERIGDERFAVWFGDATWAFAADGTAEVVIRVGAGVTHEWLRRTFRADVEAAARSVCGDRASVSWEPSGETAPAAHSTSSEPADGPRHRSRAATRLVARPSATLTVVNGEPASGPVSPAMPPRPGRGRGEFVVGPCNRMAYAAVEIAASRPGEMSPLVIHGPSGVGKSHLLEAACSLSRQRHPGIQTVYLSAEQFTTSFLQALRAGGMPGFRRSVRSADMLAIDDLQFFIGKRATIQELQQTIDALCRQGKQVLIGSDKDLDALGELGNDLLSRLRGGMTARLLPPDYDVRRRIVTALAKVRGLEIADDVVHHVAVHMTRHARELAGAVNRLEATSHMLGLPITLDLAQEALADLVRSSSRCLRLADIERAVCGAFGIEEGGLQSSRRSRAVSHPRMLAMYLARKHTRAALAEIGSHFGRRSHSTVVTAQKTVTSWLSAKTPVVLGGVAWDAAEAIRRVEDMLRTT